MELGLEVALDRYWLDWLLTGLGKGGLPGLPGVAAVVAASGPAVLTGGVHAGYEA